MPNLALVSGKALPCGCENRKEIMFTQGRPGLTEGAILGGMIALVIIAWRLNT